MCSRRRIIHHRHRGVVSSAIQKVLPLVLILPFAFSSCPSLDRITPVQARAVRHRGMMLSRDPEVLPFAFAPCSSMSLHGVEQGTMQGQALITG